MIPFSNEMLFSRAEMVASETGFNVSKSTKAAPNKVKHVGKKRRVANPQISVTSDGRKCPLIVWDEGERLNGTSDIKILAMTRAGG